MFSLRTFRITSPTLKDLREAGLDDRSLAQLKSLEGQTFSSRQEFLAQLAQLIPSPADPKVFKLILRFSRRSLLRLEGIIPNRVYREWAEAFIFAVIMALVLRVFVVAPFKIPSGSMVPTIAVGDHIFATMFSYGLPIPFSSERVLPQDIDRGDIIIFPYPLDPDKDYIKRVIGLGGERLEVRGLKVYINDRLLEEPYAYHDPVILEQLRKMDREPPSFGPVEVPEGHLFVMGDNRFNSADSRVWGFVDVKTVKGRGQIIYWSHDPAAGFLGGYQLNRIGMLLR